mmetsp:Transcript_363/g.974  ORF Transcript_363/g.974 Transcript_363/m.974 type:complete len:329 (-) Transcript_363:1236-2222(-)
MVALLSSKAAVGLNRPSICTRRAVAVTMTRPKVAVAPMSTSKRSSTMARAAAEAEPNASNDNEGFYEAVSVGMDDSMSLPDLKAALLDSLYGTERGLSARSEVRAEINELISQMESMSPVPNPTEALDKLSGNWKLVYTSNSELMAVLALSKLPLVDIGDITQKIDAEDAKVENKVRLSVPFTRTSLSTTASFEVRSPKRLQLRLTKGGIQTPELISDLNLPPYVTVMGTTVDLGPLKSAIGPMQSAASGVLSQVNNLLSQLPPPQVDISNDSAQTWQLNTYVDDDTRISRGDGGSVFIYVREAELDDWPPAEPVIAAVEPEAEEDVV